ncbi:MAG: CotH kinase family protein [bacterium]
MSRKYRLIWVLFTTVRIYETIYRPFNHYFGKIGIELRGNSTQSFPKQPYLLETRDESGNNLNVSLLNMPEDNDWILLASYIDRTLIRTPLAHYLSMSTGQWSNRSRFCELVVNGEYLGIYLLMENIKRGKERLDINELNPDEISGEDITGGYIYEITGFGGDFGENRKLHYPAIDEITVEQLNYIRDYDDNFRSIMNSTSFADPDNGYSKWISVSSFIEEILVQETVRNSDAYGWSAYFHKDKNKKLHAGPVWDFDQSSGNSTYLDGGNSSGWVLDYETDQPFFWKKLFDESNFQESLKLKWQELRNNKFDTANVLAFIDSCANYLNEAQERNFEKWPILGKFIWRETAGYNLRDTYQKEVDYLKTYMASRVSWMDEQLKINQTFVEPNPDAIIKDFILEQNFPNPFNPTTVIRYTIPAAVETPYMASLQHVTLKIYDVLGNKVATLVDETKLPGIYEVKFDSNALSSGVNFYQLRAGSKGISKKMVILK